MADQPVEAPGEPVPSQLSSPCRHLRSKGMYVYTDNSSIEESSDCDNTNFWCQKTSKDIGPDDGFVGREDCRDAARGCYEAD